MLELRERDVAHLTVPQRAAREALIEELARYAREGRFPRNHVSREQTPIFIDPHGTRCAMARLIESTGHAALVAEVAAGRNFALIRELEGDVTLQAWLDEFGLTAAEAGRIQPSYCFVTRADDCFCNELGYFEPNAVLEGVVVEEQTAGEIRIRVEAVHGTTEWEVGDTVTADTTYADTPPAIGDFVLVAQSEQENTLVQLEDDQTYVVDCGKDLPALAKETVIAALRAGGGEQCAAVLQKESSEWGESICDDSGCGCVAHESGSGGPLLVSTALLLAFVRRRRRR